VVRAPAASVLLAGVLVSACGAERARAPADRVPAPAGTTRYVDERRGFEVTFPSAWRRARRVLTPALWEPREILSVGTVRPVANGPASRCAQHPTAAMGRLGPRDVFLTIQERTNQVSGGMEPGPPRLADVTADDSELPACVGHDVPFETYWMPFRSGARGFYANAAIGDDVPPARRAQLQRVLASLRFRRVRVEDDRQRGVRFAYPRPWRIYPFRLTGVQLHHQIALGTFALEQGRPDPNCTPATALRARERDGGLLFAFEYAGLSEAQKRRFPLRPARFRLNPRDPVAYECLGHSSLIRWREAASGRVFQAHLYGPRRWVQQALGILDSFEISRQGR
jgi:hypothetical protein